VLERQAPLRLGQPVRLRVQNRQRTPFPLQM
jgi:hypothetical protein